MDRSFPENEILLIIAVGILVMMLLALAFVLFFYFSQRKFQAQQMEAQQREMEHQEQLLFGSIQAQEKERRRLARELHDEIGSKLNVINLGLHRLRKAVSPEQEDTVQQLFGALGTTIDTSRRISHGLLPPTLENFGLAAALEELFDQHEQATDVRLSMDLRKEDGHREDQAISLHLFRVCQELLSNSLKYAHARQVNLSLWQKKHSIQLAYDDDGQGFDTNDPARQKGLGMQNIESRMRMIGATYTFESQPGKGVRFQAKKQLT